MALLPILLERRAGQRPSNESRVSLAMAVAMAVTLTATGCGCGPSPGGADGDGFDAGNIDAGYDAGVLRLDAGIDGGVDAGTPPVLHLTRVLPPRGSAAGGSVATLEGSGFLRGLGTSGSQAKSLTSISFSSNPVLSFQIIDDATVELTVPPGLAGAVSVSMKNPNGAATCSRCFTYYDELAVTSLAPKVGPLLGGTEVTVMGQGFTTATMVLFGDWSSPRVTVVSATQLIAVAPKGLATGLVDVVLFDHAGVSTQRRAYRYLPDLRISQVTPATGPLEGGSRVTVLGRGFTGATAVRLSGVSATDVTVDSDSQLTATTPAGVSLGPVDVTVTTPSDTWTARGAFTYVSPDGGFTTSGVFPHVVTAGDTVTLTGQGLDQGVLDVTIGGQPAAVGARTFSTAVLTVPARGDAPRRFDVVAVAGGVPSSLSSAVTWKMALSTLTPALGPSDGGTAVSLAGTALPPSLGVWVGALEGSGVVVTSGTQADFITPPGSGGAASDVVARELSDPENEVILPGGFTFLEPLAIGRAQPERGAVAGGTLVTILGRGFGDATVVSFGDAKAKDVKIIDSHTITCRAPKGEVGVVDVGVKRLGQQDALVAGYSYFDPRSISGGVSGGPLVGTLNVTVLESTPALYGAPVERATVLLGVDSTTPFQGLTDVRGQLTFSDPSLVKAQTVTAFKEGYGASTVSLVSSENLTVFIGRTQGGSDGNPSPSPGSGGVAASSISGRVTGFKSPRPLSADERLEARVFLAQSSLFEGPPFGGRAGQPGEKWRVTSDGAEYVLFSSGGVRAVYAVLGIVGADTASFTPVTMGIARGISTSPDNPAIGRDIVLDVQLDLTVPVTIDTPLMLSLDGGVEAATNGLYAWLDLGAEGFIPNPYNWDTGMGFTSSVSSVEPHLRFPGFPQLDGTSFIFLDEARGEDFYPSSVFFRRQSGDLRSGVTIGPMLAVPTLTEPTGAFEGTIAWRTEPGGVPDLHSVSILEESPLGTLTVWSVVLPGTETRVELPPAAVEALRRQAQGRSLYLVINSARTPKFSYSQWTLNDALSVASWSAFTTVVSERFSP